MSIKLATKKAFESFLSGDYLESLKLYEKLKVDLNSNVFDFNIYLCKKNIKEVNKKPFPRVCLIRIFGNDLSGLHSDNQSIDNLNFILKNEPEYPNVDKVFLLNRVVSESKLQKLKEIIKNYGKNFVEIKFKKEEYISIPFYDQDLPSDEYFLNNSLDDWDKLCIEVSKRKLKNKYLMNNNGARNYALKYGKTHNYDWVLPWDGNSFLSENQFEKLQNTLIEVDGKKDYIIVPMERLLDNKSDLANQISQNANEEPQIAFSKKSNLIYSSDRVYGNQPKVELLKRLGVPGDWDEWTKEYPWKDFVVQEDETEKNKWVKSSSVFRLASGNHKSAIDSKSRGNLRAKAIVGFCDYVYKLNSKICLKSNELENRNLLNEFFDHVYVVNLPGKYKDRLLVSKHLNEKNIEFEIFEATNGYSEEIKKQYYDYSKKPLGNLIRYKESSSVEIKRGNKLIESPGAMGYIHTYVRILKDAKVRGFKKILIFEDDVLLDADFEEKVRDFLEKTPNDWKVLQLGASQYGWKDLIEKEMLKRGYYYPRRVEDCETCGSFAIAFSSDIYDELIEAQLTFEAPFDHLPMGEIYEKYLEKCFVVYPNIVIPDVEESTIRVGRSQVQHSRRVKWKLENFDYPLNKPSIGVFIENHESVKYLESFQNQCDLPYNLRLYYFTNDGLRPLHNFESNINLIPLRDKEVIVPEGDFFVKIKDEFILSEDDIRRFIEYKYNLRKSYQGALIELDFNSLNYKSERVSVIIPTYKRPENLKAAILSVINQEYHDIELIIVDDNGDESEFQAETNEVLKSIKYSNDIILKVIYHKENRNGSAARNTGIFNSTGEYISFLDDDDIYLPGRLSESIKILKNSSKNIGAVYCGFIGWNSPENNLQRYKSGDLTEDILTLNYKAHYLHTNTATYKRNAVFDINGFDESYKRHQDLEFNLRFFESYNMDVVKEALVQLNPVPSNISNKVFNIEMLNLKVKFLTQFSYIIERFCPEKSNNIYVSHWAEVLKYTKNKEEILSNLKKMNSNGPLYLSLALD